MNIKIVCATSSVANVGIDCKDIQFDIKIDLPLSIWDPAQEMVYTGRGPFATDLIYLFKHINDPTK